MPMQSRNLKDLVHFDPDGVRREPLFETEHIWSEILCFDGKQTLGPMADPESDAMFTVLAGEGRFIVGRRSKTLRQWGSLLADAESEVTVFNVHDEPLVVLLIASPPPADEDDEEDEDEDERIDDDGEVGDADEDVGDDADDELDEEIGAEANGQARD